MEGVRAVCAQAEVICIGASALLLLLCLAPAAHADDYFVAPTGSDQTGSGSITRPFATIHRALSAAMPGDSVLLRAGEYRLAGGEGSIHFPRAGDPGRPITLAAYKDEYVALLGSVRLVDWQPYQGHVYRCPAPPKFVCGLFEDALRLNMPRERGKRIAPAISSIQLPGQWTEADGQVYLWCREGDNPAKHRIEASQMGVVGVNQPWVRVEKLHMFFGQPVGLDLGADHDTADDVEVAHVSNSVDNAYGAYISDCSNSALIHSTIHDSYYWGDHSSNSHLVCCIDAGDTGPNYVVGCDVFNGGLGVGTKGAVREMVVAGNRLHDMMKGVVPSAQRLHGPGAGKTDRGHYMVYDNRFSHCADGVFFDLGPGASHGNKILNNLFWHCGVAISMRTLKSFKPEIANNVLVDNGVGLNLVGGYKGQDTLPLFHDAGLSSHDNLFYGNKLNWLSPLDWSRSQKMTVAQVQAYRDYHWEQGSISEDPLLDADGLPGKGSPAPGRGVKIVLPDYLPQPVPAFLPIPPDQRIGPWPPAHLPGADVARVARLALSIAGSSANAVAGQAVSLKASLKNVSSKALSLAGDAIVTFLFRNANVWYFDRQEVYRVRVQLPGRPLAGEESLDLTALPGWHNPVDGKPGDPFYLRADDSDWRAGWRLSATLRLVKRGEATAAAVQRLEPLVYSTHVFHVDAR